MKYVILRKIRIAMKRIRTFYWRRLLKHFGKSSRVLGRIIVYGPENVEVGSNTSINEGVMLNARERIVIGNYVHLSPYCALQTGGLDYKGTLHLRKHIARPIFIEDGVWVGTGAIINPGVRIGKNSVIGAGAVVTSDIPENSIAVGVPAKVVKQIYD